MRLDLWGRGFGEASMCNQPEFESDELKTKICRIPREGHND